MAKTYKAPAIRRAAEILEHLSECADPPTLSELSRGLGYGKSTVHGLLQSLESLGWVARAGNGYALGPGLLELARRAAAAGDLGALARRPMEDLAERLGEAVFVGKPRGDVVVVLDWVEGRGDLRVSSRPGMELPLFAGALGKVFLAALPREEARAALERTELPRFTDRSITDPEEFLREVDRARTLGDAVDDEEYLRGVRAVAAPVLCGGKAVAALWVAGFTSRLTDDQVVAAGALLVRAVATVSRGLFPAPATP